jgi:hypothetical protein
VEVKEMARDSKRIYRVLYEKGPLSMPEMRDLLRAEGFEMAWIGANNSHRKYRIAIVVTSTTNYYGLTLAGKRQLSAWGK